MMFKRCTAIVVLAFACAAGVPVAAAQQSSQPQAAQQEFVPIDQLPQLPPQDQLPAAPLLIGAYVFVPAVLFLYLVSLARRMSAVQREIERLEMDLRRPGRA
jgi:CcmD family protein